MATPRPKALDGSRLQAHGDDRSCYVVGGLLILTRRRGLSIAGAVINALILVFWLEADQARPAVLFSSGGIVSKTAQVLLELVAALPRTPVRQIAVRAADLSSESLTAIAGMIEHVRRLEGLPNGTAP